MNELGGILKGTQSALEQRSAAECGLKPLFGGGPCPALTPITG